MNTRTNHRPSFWLIFALVAVLLLAITSPSFADDVTGSADVTGGTLDIEAADNPTFVETFLDGTDQTQTDDIDILVTDFTGTGAGWKLQITSTAFTDGSHSLANDAMTIESVAVICNGGTCTNPTNNIGYAVIVPADTVAPLAVDFFNAAVDTGMGDFTVSPTFELNIPADTYAGAYSSTVTLTVASAP